MKMKEKYYGVAGVNACGVYNDYENVLKTVHTAITMTLIIGVLFTIIGIAAFGSAPGASTLIRLLIFVTSGAIGGIIGVGNTDKRKIV